MANPTTNYGFVLPTPTDLVTDLPADFDVALQGVDTRLKALQPGTTLGDIAYSSATANTNTRLGIGTTGQVLSVSGGVPAWATPAAGGGMTLLSTTTLSGATVTISSINQTHKSLLLVVYGVTNASSDGIFRIAINGSTNTTTTTQFNSSTSTFSLFNNDYLRMSAGQNLLMSQSNNGWGVQIDNYANTTNFKPILMYGNAQTSGASPGKMGFGVYESSSAITSLVFSNSGGNLSTGTVLLYGVS
jgi:hypothetical protein